MSKPFRAFIGLCVLAIGLGIYALISHDHGTWQLIKVTESSSNLAIYEYEYSSDGDRHAPYGRYLFLAPKNTVKVPYSYHVIFAGYCNNLLYGWSRTGDIGLDLSDCPEENIRTLSRKVLGITVYGHGQTHNKAIQH